MKQCQQCGKDVLEGAAFCVHCGAQVESGVPSANSSTGINTGGFQSPGNGNDGMVNTGMNNMMQQPMMSQSGVMATAGPVQPGTVESPKKKIDGKMLGMIAACAISLIIGIVGIVVAISSNKGGDGDKVAVDTGGGADVVDVTNSGTKVELSGYELVVPEGWEYEFSSDGTVDYLMYAKDGSAVMMTAYIETADFASISSDPNSLSLSLVESGQASNAKCSNTSAGGIDYVFCTANMGGQYAGFAFSDADFRAFYTMIFMSDGSAPDESILEDVSTVLSTAKKKSGTSKTFVDAEAPLQNFSKQGLTAIRGITTE